MTLLEEDAIEFELLELEKKPKSEDDGRGVGEESILAEEKQIKFKRKYRPSKWLCTPQRPLDSNEGDDNDDNDDEECICRLESVEHHTVI